MPRQVVLRGTGSVMTEVEFPVWLLALLEPRIRHDARPELLDPASGIGSQGQRFREFHAPAS